MSDAPSSRPLVLTIGHSTRSLAEFIELLKNHEAARVVDVRTVPRSRRNPQFNQETLPQALSVAGMGYIHLPGLGGLRRPRPDSPNTGWQNDSFRGFADYMLTPEFEQNLVELMCMAQEERCVLMCAEAVPWRCHRSLIADALIVRQVRVEHILGLARRQIHRLTPWAFVQDGRLIYAAALPAGGHLEK